MRMLRFVTAFSALLIAGAAPAASGDSPALIELAAAGDPLPAVEVSSRADGGLTLQLRLTALELEQIELGGQRFQQLAIPGGGFRGAVGQAALPTLTRLVAVPPGMTVKARGSIGQERTLTGYRLAPEQPVRSAAEAQDKLALELDAAWYEADSFEEVPPVVVGEPARLRELMVVPITFQPARYRPASGEVAVATSITAQLSFAPDLAAAAFTPPAYIPSSFDRLYSDLLVNYERGGAQVGPGSYLVICPDNAAVLTSLQPLLNWRRRQGYNVIVATTAQTGTTNTAIKSYIQGVYDNAAVPLEFVVLVGDATGSIVIPTWFESLSGYNGEGDHPYTQLSGGDVLSDVHIGRLSAASTTDLDNIVRKLVDYESAPPTGADPGWFTRASLTADRSSSGITTIFTSQWLKNQLLARGYTQIDTIFGGNFTSLMVASLNQGGTVFTYRGYLGMSGMQSSHILASTNGIELPFAVILTCDTGSFSRDTTCRAEAFLKAANGGGVAGIGTATIGTHTRYNNCIFGGIMHGVLNTQEHRLGPALTRGKYELYLNYNQAEPNRVAIWSHWNNLMGDPATEMWTGYPGDLSVTHPTLLPTAAGSALVSVTGGGAPLPGASVALYQEGQVSVAGVTDAAGTVNLPLGTLAPGSLLVTVTGHDRKPYLGSLTVGSPAQHVAPTESSYADGDGGNGDGLPNPGEMAELSVRLTNLGTTLAGAVTATLSSADPYVTIVAAQATYGDLAPSGGSWGDQPFLLTLAPGTPDGHVVRLDLRAASGALSWTSLLELTAQAPSFLVESQVFGGPGGNLDPGEEGSLTVTIRNIGSVHSTGASALLLSHSPWVSVTDAEGAFNAAGIGGTATNTGDPFAVSIAPDCFRGHLAAFSLVLDLNGGAQDTVMFTAQVGTAATTDPVGPDRYGYYAFDNTDTSYPHAPVYDWVEIDPGLGGPGVHAGLGDFGWEQDATVTVDLPFPFTYYGRTHQRLSICSNGWVAMGATYLRGYRNWTLPSAGSPDAMIAVFWDNLYQDSGSGGIFTWHDETNHRFIVEWSRVRNDWNNSLETFQLLLHDPTHHPTDTGDGIIVCQYHTVNNVDSENGYATVGIQNHDRTDGLLYTYWNRYPAGAPALQAGRAIRFVPLSPEAPGYLEGDVVNASAGGAPIAGAQVRVVERSRVLQTQAGGHYFGSVPPGSYTVVAEHPSFRPDSAAAVAVVEGQTTVLNFALVDIAGPAFAGTTHLPNTVDTVGPYVIESVVTDHSTVADVRCYWTSSADGGATHEAALALVDPVQRRYRAEIPGQPLGARVQYWLTASDAVGNVSAEPAGAPWQLHVFQVATQSVLLFDDMESDSGWTVGAAGDNATAGFWTRVDPNGVWNGAVLVQPEDDATPAPGVMCWITGNDPPGSAQGTDDVDGGRTTLLSPWYDLSGHSGVNLTYKRWYTNDTGNSPGLDVWRVEATGNGTEWVTLESTTASNRTWLSVAFPLGDHIPLTSTVRLRFIAEDLSPGSVVEAGVDDLLLVGYAAVADAGPPAVTLSAPLGGEILPAGGAFLVTWSAGDDLGVVQTMLLLSTDGGATYPDTLAVGALPGGSWEWTVPAIQAAHCRLQVICRDAAGNAASDATAADFAIANLTGIGDAPDAPAALVLRPNRPNPFNPATEISYGLPSPQRVTLRVYDAAGRLVATLVDGEQPAGFHVQTWRGTDDRGARVASGAYFYRLETPAGALTRKLTLVK